MSVLWLALAILQTLLEGVLHVQQSSFEAILGTHKPAFTETVGSVEVSSVQGAANALVVELGKTANSLCGNMSQYNQKLETTWDGLRHHLLLLRMRRWREELVSGKKALKKHLQRSVDKLVAAKEQLPEEDGREVAQDLKGAFYHGLLEKAVRRWGCVLEPCKR